MILSLCLMLSAPGMAGRRADREATEARLAQLELEVVQLQAFRDAMTMAYADQQGDLAALQRQLADDQATLDELAESLGALERQTEAIRLVLSASPPKKGKVDPQILALQTDLLALQAELEAQRKAATASTARAASDEEAASKLLSDAAAAVEAFDYPRARALYAQLSEQYPLSSAASRSARALRELGVVGNPAVQPVVTRWFTAPAALSDAPLTLLIFWEQWCPHCKREVPASAKWLDQYGARGLQIIALTRITKSSTPEKVEAFIDEYKLPFAVAQEDGSIAEAYAVSGIPAAALVKDGVVVWRGHPARLTPEMIERFLADPPR